MGIWAAVAPALVQAGGSLLGGFMSKREGDKNRARQDDQLQRLVKDAKAAGISPLAALGSSVSGQYGSPVGSTETGSYIADAFKAGSKAVGPMGKLQIENARKQNELLDANIDLLKSEAMLNATRVTRTPTAAQVDEERTLNNFYGADPYAVRPEDARMTHGPHKGQYLYKYGGKYYVTDKRFSRAELLEGLIGNVASEGAGLSEITENMFNPFTRKTGASRRRSGRFSSSPPGRTPMDRRRK